MTANFGVWFNLFLILFFTRPWAESDVLMFIRSTMVMGAVAVGLGVLSWGTFNGWISHLSGKVGAGAAAGALMCIILAYIIQKADIPFVPNNVETMMRYFLYIFGAVLMLGSSDWNAYFTDLTGLINGKGAGIEGIAKDMLNILTLASNNK